MSRAFRVLLDGHLAGRLIEDEAGTVGFRFLDEYLHLERRPVLSQSFEDDLAKTYRRRHGELPPYFANLVPEGAMRKLLEENLRVECGDDLALLGAVGVDLPGAVEIRQYSADEITDPPDPGKAETSPAEPGVPEGELRFSLAGVQLKFSLLREHEKLTLPAHGERGEWIVKLDSRQFPRLVENEFAMLGWAHAAGFDIPEHALRPAAALPPPLRSHTPEGSHVLVIRRFDRDGRRRIHQEDFAQVIGVMPHLKYDNATYQQCATLVHATVGEDAYLEFVRRLVFMVASGNGDAHLKNWSLIYPDGIAAALTPLYDQVCTIAWPEMPRKWALRFDGSGEMAQVDEGAFERLASHTGADRGRTLAAVRECLERLAATWPQAAAARQHMPAAQLLALEDHWRRVPLLRRFAPLGGPTR